VQVRQSSKIVVFTGAGISTACGIPDFRGPSGIWTLQRAHRPIPAFKVSFGIAKPSLCHQVCASYTLCWQRLQSLSLLFAHCNNSSPSKQWSICNRRLWLCYTQASCSILCRKMWMGYIYDQAFLEAGWQNCMATALQSDAPNASESTSATLRWRL